MMRGKTFTNTVLYDLNINDVINVEDLVSWLKEFIDDISVYSTYEIEQLEIHINLTAADLESRY